MGEEMFPWRQLQHYLQINYKLLFQLTQALTFQKELSLNVTQPLTFQKELSLNLTADDISLTSILAKTKSEGIDFTNMVLWNTKLFSMMPFGKRLPLVTSASQTFSPQVKSSETLSNQI